jgi:hypothetical protein
LFELAHNRGMVQFCNPIQPEKDYTIGKENEDRLWALGEAMIGEKF